MKELSIEEKAKRYDEVLAMAKECLKNGTITNTAISYIGTIFPELKEREDEKIRNMLIEFFSKGAKNNCYTNNISDKDILAWLEKQGKKSVMWEENTDDNKPQKNHSVLMKTTHGITEGEWKGDESWIQYRWSGSIKDSDVLSWMELSDLDNQGEHEHTKLSEENDIDENHKIGKWFTGLIPCWINAPSTLQPAHSHHGKNVIAIHLKGGGYKCCCIDDKKPIVFTVAENTPFEEGWYNRETFTKKDVDDAYLKGVCDAKSELEKQGEQPSAIRWYDVSLIPQEMKELLVEWDSEDATWHEIAFYRADTKTFWNGTRQVENVTRWCYIVDLLEKQGEQKYADKVKPKFEVGDTMRTKQEAADGFADGMPVVVSIDEEYYHCNNELIAIKDQDSYEYPPMNRMHKPVEPKFKVGDWVTIK